MSHGLRRVEQRLLAELRVAEAPLPGHRIIDRMISPAPTHSDKVCVRQTLASLKRKRLVEREKRGWVYARVCRLAAVEAVRISSAVLEAGYQRRRSVRAGQPGSRSARGRGSAARNGAGARRGGGLQCPPAHADEFAARDGSGPARRPKARAVHPCLAAPIPYFFRTQSDLAQRLPANP